MAGLMCFSCILIPQLDCARGDPQGPAGIWHRGVWAPSKGTPPPRVRDLAQMGLGSQQRGIPSPGRRRLSPQHPLEERGHPALGFRESLDPWTEPLLFLRWV